MLKIPVRTIQVDNGEPDLSENFRIRELKSVMRGKDMNQDVHRHDFFFVLALRKGNGKHAIDFKPYKVSDGTIFFMRPGQVHQLSLTAGSEGLIMEFKPGFYRSHDKTQRQLLRTAGNANYCKPDRAAFESIYSLLSSMQVEYTHRADAFDEAIRANLTLFFVEWTRHRRVNSSQTNINSYAQERLEHFLELVEKDVVAHKEVMHYADQLNLSIYQLNAITKSTLGKTSSEVITEYVVLEAKRCLLATSLLVSQTAYDLGFEDVSYFIRFFKKHTGYTPDAFRAKFR